MKNILYITLLMTPFVFSQDLDEDYLNSLPEKVRKDVMDTVDAKEATEDPVYRRASSMIDKEDGYERQDHKKQKVFGEKIFDLMQSSFMPINEPNFDGSYILDYGDEIEVQMIGQENSTNKYLIKRDGSVNLENIGIVNIGGLPLDEAISLIKAKVSNSFIGTSSYISLTNVRDIQVVVAGNAFNPGVYTLNGNSNILHALTMAGGIDENGSYREIKLIRNNELIEKIDLYDIFIYGSSNFGNRLRTGDSILVGASKNLVNILSGVNRPFIYELTKGETFEDLINFANGLSSNADLDFIQLQRLEKDQITVQKVLKDDMFSLVLKDDDLLIIREYKFGSVIINGAVKAPGEYKIRNGDTLKQLIIRAGGYENYAYPFGGYLDNKTSREINQQSKKRLYDQFIKSLIDNPGTNTTPASETFPLIMEEFKEAPATGRIIAEFNLDVLNAKPELDTLLEDGDEIHIPIRTQQVYVYGEVSNSGAVRYSPNKNLDYYINNAGGILKSGDAETIFIVHPNGKTVNLDASRGSLSFIVERNNSTLIYPGSIVYVPREAVSNNIRAAAIWAPILSSISLSIASISAINR